MATKTPKKGHRPAHGEGSFYWDDTVKAWRGAYDAGISSDGKRRRVTVRAKDEDEAWQKFVARRKQVMLEGAPAEGVKANETVKGWCLEWLPMHKENVKPRSYATDRSRVTRHIIPALGRVQLTELTATHMAKLAKHVRDSGSSATNANNVQRTFAQLLRDAKGAGHKVPDRILAARRAKPAKSTRRALAVAEAATILKHAWATIPDHSRWDVALFQGIRQGEALGLTWDRVDLKAGLLDISWQLQTLPYADRAKDTFDIPEDLEAERLVGAYHLTRPKTEAGQRVIPMIPQVVDVLTAWREVAPESRWGLVWPRMPWVDAAPARVGWPRNLKDDLDQWKGLQDATGVVKDPEVPTGKAGRYYVGHELRHTTISLLVAAGIPDRIIEQIVGQTTLVRSYVHSDIEAMRAALAEIGLSMSSVRQIDGT